MKYEVTIGIPVYNVCKYIRHCMDSALAQTFASIEFLVLDDCGTDSSIDIVREYQQTHPRGKDIRIVSQSKNGGLGCARNRIIDEAQGKYLFHLDADDAIAPNTIQLLYENAKKYNAQIVYDSHMRIEQLDGSTQEIPVVYPSLQFFKEDEWPTYVYREYNGIQAQTWNFLIDMDIYRKNGLRHKPINFWEDYTFTMDLPTYITRAVLLPDITYYYYCRAGSLSNYEYREHIDKQEIVTTANAVEEIKAQTDRLRNKSYFPRRMYKLMVTDFYIVCIVLRYRKIISPSFTNKELHDIMRTPLTLGEILRFRQARITNLILYFYWMLPASLSVFAMRLTASIRRLI